MVRIKGFNGYADSDADQDEKAEKLEQVNIFKEHIESIYSPIGSTEDKIYKTIQELVYEMDNIVEGVTTTKLAAVLKTAGYKIEHIGGVPYWVMYEKTPYKI